MYEQLLAFVREELRQAYEAFSTNPAGHPAVHVHGKMVNTSNYERLTLAMRAYEHISCNVRGNGDARVSTMRTMPLGEVVRWLAQHPEPGDDGPTVREEG